MWDTIRIIEATAAGLLVVASFLVARALLLAENAGGPRRTARIEEHRRKRDERSSADHAKAA